MLTLEDIANLRELEAKATRGPWSLDPHFKVFLWGPNSQMIADNGQEFVPEEERITRMRGVGAQLPLEVNGELIATSRNHLTALLDIAERSLKPVKIGPEQGREQIEAGSLMYWYECPACGDELILRSMNFCPNCGRRLEWI